MILLYTRRHTIATGYHHHQPDVMDDADDDEATRRTQTSRCIARSIDRVRVPKRTHVRVRVCVRILSGRETSSRASGSSSTSNVVVVVVVRRRWSNCTFYVHARPPIPFLSAFPHPCSIPSSSIPATVCTSGTEHRKSFNFLRQLTPCFGKTAGNRPPSRLI